MVMPLIEMLRAPDGALLQVARFEPGGTPKAVVQILHGFGEHIDSYRALAAFFAEHNYACVIHDQRGFGSMPDKTEKQRAATQGVVADYTLFLDDAALIRTYIGAWYPGLPVFLYGHSMGGNIAISYLLRQAQCGGNSACETPQSGGNLERGAQASGNGQARKAPQSGNEQAHGTRQSGINSERGTQASGNGQAHEAPQSGDKPERDTPQKSDLSYSKVILESPWLRLYKPPAALTVAAARLIGRFSYKAAIVSRLPASDISRGEKSAEARNNDPYYHNRLSLRLFTQITDAGERAIADAGRITAPTLLLRAGADKIVCPKAILEFFQNAGENVVMENYPDGYHALRNDSVKDAVLDRMLAFCAERAT